MTRLAPLAAASLLVAATSGPLPAQQLPQTQADSYARYELLAPESHGFRIYYDVAATTPGATRYFNSIRAGAESTVHGVYDRTTGRALEWKVVTGAEARTSGHPDASADGRYIQVTLARPVPEGGEARVRIDKTYVDPNSYRSTGDEITFSRSLGIERNAVVLPDGYELTGVNYPSQVVLEPDGRVKVSFMNRGPAPVPYEVRGRRLPASSVGGSSPGQRSATSGVPVPAPSARGAGPARTAPDSRPDGVAEASSAVSVRRPLLQPDDRPDGDPAEAGSSGPATAAGSVSATPPIAQQARVDYAFPERAFQDREIVYFLQQPESHSFRLYHDYTETRPGMDRYLNVVRAGSKASDPSAHILDTGQELEVETLAGDELTRRGVDIGRPPTPETEVVVIWFDPVPDGGSVRLRIEETYTDPNRYVLAGDELIWDRAFGRPQNTVILPPGWHLTASSIPAVVTETEDGRIQLDYVNDRPGDIDVFIRARRR